MITAIQNVNNMKVIANETIKSDGPFCCPKCSSEVILRRGKIKVPHFAHKPPVYCQYGKGESDAHRNCKQVIYNFLKRNESVSECELEKDLGKVVPDIFFLHNGHKIAIEVQISNFTMSRIIERTQEYAKLGVYVLWLSTFDQALNSKVYAPKQWEKWLHATYYGRVYYWCGGLALTSVHFNEHQLWVEESNWYSSYGDEMSAGGYFKTSKRYREPLKGPVVNILNDFKPKWRSGWQGGNIEVPPCRILIDQSDSWW